MFCEAHLEAMAEASRAPSGRTCPRCGAAVRIGPLCHGCASSITARRAIVARTAAGSSGVWLCEDLEPGELEGVGGETVTLADDYRPDRCDDWRQRS
jgi:hypothetical protein